MAGGERPPTDVIDTPHPDRPQQRLVQVEAPNGDKVAYESDVSPTTRESGDTTVLGDVGSIDNMLVQATGPEATIISRYDETMSDMRIVRDPITGSVAVTGEGSLRA